MRWALWPVYFARRHRVLVGAIRVGLLLIGVARMLNAHAEVRPIYSSASVSAVVVNNLYHLIGR